jgi:hypothetical protein
MFSALIINRGMIRGLFVLGTVAFAGGTYACAQTAAPSPNDGWQRYDWLTPANDQKQQAAAEGTVTTSASQDIKDPFSVVTTGALWQEKTDTIYTRHLADSLTLSYESGSTLLNEASTPVPPLAGGAPDDLVRTEKIGLQFQPVDQVTVGGNVHAANTDAAMPGDTVVTSGAGFSAQGKLPTNSVLIFGANSDRTAADSSNASVTTDTTYDAQISQPVGNLPLSAQLKGHYEETQTTGSPLGKTPSLEQSLTWKPMEDTTIQMGLRQQQYQEYPGIDNQFNEAIFADFSQKVVSNMSWHSYGELLNTRGLIDQAPASPLASGANGTPQATGPGANISPANSIPLSLQDQTLTLSTGPSFQLQKDLSASLEYSNRWDKNPAPGSVGQEQRLSLSVKGSF